MKILGKRIFEMEAGDLLDSVKFSEGIKKPSGQDRTAAEGKFVAEATRRRRRILQAGFFHIRHNYKNDCYIFGNFCAYTVKTASSEAYP